MKTFEGKWVAIKPWTEQCYIGAAEIMFVHKETAKQVKVSRSQQDNRPIDIRTISKLDVIGVVMVEDIEEVKKKAEVLRKEYQKKRMDLYSTYLNMMIGVARSK